MVPEFRTSPVWVKLTLSKETTAKSKAFLDLCACFVQKHQATIAGKIKQKNSGRLLRAQAATNGLVRCGLDSPTEQARAILRPDINEDAARCFHRMHQF